jgi:hypothetical protein
LAPGVGRSFQGGRHGRFPSLAPFCTPITAGAILEFEGLENGARFLFELWLLKLARDRRDRITPHCIGSEAFDKCLRPETGLNWPLVWAHLFAYNQAMLALNSPRWATLEVRSGSAVGVPSEITFLLEHPDDTERFADLSSELCSEDTTWSAAYAAVPYLLEIARKQSLEARGYALVSIGFVVMCSADTVVPDDLWAAYRGAVSSTLPLLLETMHLPVSGDDLRYQFLAVAALKGHLALAELMNVLDADMVCPECNQPLGDVFEAFGIVRESGLDSKSQQSSQT